MIGHKFVDYFLYGFVFFAFSWVAEDPKGASKILEEMSCCKQWIPKDSCDHLRVSDSLKFRPQFRCCFTVSVLVILRDCIFRSSKVGSNALHDDPGGARVKSDEKAPVRLHQFSNLSGKGLPLRATQTAELIKLELTKAQPRASYDAVLIFGKYRGEPSLEEFVLFFRYAYCRVAEIARGVGELEEFTESLVDKEEVGLISVIGDCPGGGTSLDRPGARNCCPCFQSKCSRHDF